MYRAQHSLLATKYTFHVNGDWRMIVSSFSRVGRPCFSFSKPHESSWMLSSCGPYHSTKTRTVSTSLPLVICMVLSNNMSYCTCLDTSHVSCTTKLLKTASFQASHMARRARLLQGSTYSKQLWIWQTQSMFLLLQTRQNNSIVFRRPLTLICFWLNKCWGSSKRFRIIFEQILCSKRCSTFVHLPHNIPNPFWSSTFSNKWPSTFLAWSTLALWPLNVNDGLLERIRLNPNEWKRLSYPCRF